MPLRVAAVQYGLGKSSLHDAVDSARRLVKTAHENGAQIVCLPEHWLLQYQETDRELIATQQLSEAA